jgi:hypothetical protein
MAQLTHEQYELLERAITRGTRIIAFRRGTEFIMVPLALRLRDGREVVEARNPTTGDDLVLAVDELEHLEVVR